jgi:hypothetical protein
MGRIDMGWASGSRLFDSVIKALKPVKAGTRSLVYSLLIPAFEDFDCDTLQECLGKDPAFDKALRTVHPDWFEES